ncbi:hypothetical protein D3C71_1566500 [compost metagenome]
MQRSAAADIQAADALGTVDFMRSEAHIVHRQFGQLDRNRAECLYSIHVKKYAALSGDRPDFLNWLNRPYFIISHHYADQYGIVPYSRSNVFWRHPACPVHRHIGNLEAFLLKLFAGMKHGMVLDSRRNDMASFTSRDSAEQCQIVALRPSPGKNPLIGRTAQRGGDGIARPVQGLLGGPSERMDARSVAVLLRHNAQHDRGHLRMHRRRGGVVQIDRSHFLFTVLLSV